jgi:hypothetical protein
VPNRIYPKYKEAVLSSAANSSLTAGTVRAMLVDTADYVYSDTHEFLSSVGAGARVATSAALASKTVVDGVFDAADTVFSAATGDPSEAMILYIDTGVDATSRLVVYLDTETGLPVTPNGADINVAWNASGIFSL